MAVFLPSFQLQFPWDALGDHNTRDLMMLLSFLGVPAQPLGHRVMHSPRAETLPPHIPGPDPNDMHTLCVRGRSVLYHVRHEGPRALGGGWLRGRAAVTQPCAQPKGLQLRDQQLPGIGTQAEGCKYASPSGGCSWPCQGGRNGWAGWSSQGCWDTAEGSPCSAWGTGNHWKSLSEAWSIPFAGTGKNHGWFLRIKG